MGLNKRLIGAGATAGAGGITPSENFKVVTYTGDGTSSQFIDVGFTPDFVWIKGRDTSDYHNLIDSSRTAGCFLNSNTSGIEDCNAAHAQIQTNGFNAKSNPNANGINYVAWCWKANEGTTSSNTDGNQTSTVQANQDAGFSIATYTASSPAANEDTIGHGLGAAPDLVIRKRTDSSGDWIVETNVTGSFIAFEGLNNTNAASSSTNSFTSTTMQTRNGTPGRTFVFYTFKSIDGFSKFGSYTGNGSTNGPIVETGFEPAFIMAKQTDDTSNWVIVDNKRSTTNPRDKGLRPNTSDSESTVSNNMVVDFLSNGFQLKQTSGSNANNGNFIYMAFAADPDTEAPTLADSFAVKTYSGNGGTQSITGFGFSPSMIWTKGRTVAYDHGLYDSVRGGGSLIYPDLTQAASTVTNGIQSFDADGVTFGANNKSNASDSTYVAWAWKADDNEPTILQETEDIDSIAIYKFEDNANDVTGNFNGTATDVTYSSSGKFNKAAEFNGSSSFINTGISNTTIPLSSNFSISAWINTNSSSGFFIAEGNFNSWSTAGFGLGLAGSNVVELSFGNNTSGGAQVQSSALAANTWHHIVGVVEIGNVLTLYVNGVSVGTNALTSTNRTSVSGGFNIGADAGGYDYTGKLDQVRFYNKALTAESVTNLYNETTAQNDTLNIGTKAIVSAQSTVSANANAGFSIVKYDGTGVAMSVPHGLSAAPTFIIVKNLTSSSAWAVFHTTLGATKYLALNESTAEGTASNVWNDTAPTATTISVGTWGPVNTSANQHIAYCFHDVAGYSKFGSYTGDGTTTKTITTGFQPDFVMIKVTSQSDNWVILDSVRGGSKNLKPNDSAAEATESGTNVEFISTGFKLIGSGPGLGQTNGSGKSYIYMAFKIN